MTDVLQFVLQLLLFPFCPLEYLLPYRHFDVVLVADRLEFDHPVGQLEISIDNFLDDGLVVLLYVVLGG